VHTIFRDLAPREEDELLEQARDLATADLEVIAWPASVPGAVRRERAKTDVARRVALRALTLCLDKDFVTQVMAAGGALAQNGTYELNGWLLAVVGYDVPRVRLTAATHPVKPGAAQARPAIFETLVEAVANALARPPLAQTRRPGYYVLFADSPGTMPKVTAGPFNTPPVVHNNVLKVELDEGEAPDGSGLYPLAAAVPYHWSLFLNSPAMSRVEAAADADKCAGYGAMTIEYLAESAP
jgi:hypothetical protein